jgi:hypothetical protein
VLSHARLTDSQDRAWLSIGFSVQERARSSPLPLELRDAVFQDALDAERAARRHKHDSALAVTKNRGTEKDLREENRFLESLINLTDLQNRELRESNKIATRQVEALTESVSELEDQIDADTAEHVSTLDQLSWTQAELSRVREALVKQKRQDDAYPHVDPEDFPSSFEDLLEIIPRLNGVKYTGDANRTLSLDETSGVKRTLYARKAWEALRSLDSYAHSKKNNFTGSFYEFCKEPPPGGRQYPQKQVAMSESNTTLSQWNEERTFPVPHYIHPDGKILMESHIKLDSRGSISPRIHFVDRTSDHQNIFVGYIGPHLRNTKTT